MRKGVIMNSSALWLCQDWMSEHAVIIPQGNDWLHSFSPLHFLWQPALQSSYTVWPTAVWHLLVVSLHDFFKAPTHTHAHTHSREASRLFSLLVFLGKCVIVVPKDFEMLSGDLWSTPLYILPNKGVDGLHSPRTTCKWTNAFLSETRTQCELKRHSHFPIQTQFKTHWACQWYNHPY